MKLIKFSKYSLKIHKYSMTEKFIQLLSNCKIKPQMGKNSNQY